MSDAETGKMTREEIKEFIFDVFVEVIEATGHAPALPPEELARLAEIPVKRMKGCMMELASEGVLDKFKDDGELFFHLTDDVLDELLEEMEADGWTPPENPFGAAELADTDNGEEPDS